MESTTSTTLVRTDPPGPQQAWQMVKSQLRMEMKRTDYETWVEPLRAIGFYEGVFRVGGHNSYSLDWVASRLRTRIIHMLEAILNTPITLRFSIFSDSGAAVAFPTPADTLADAPTLPAQQSVTTVTPVPLAETMTPEATPPVISAVELPAPGKTAEKPAKTPKTAEESPEPPPSPRKIQLQRAYGSERARIIQPERGMFLTSYFFASWLPLLGHSAFAAILAARSLCYWNPMTGELRNVVETEMGELARRADVSVRTIKEVLNHPLVRRYFLRYKIRRIMTVNGVRTAGIILQVRMDDPLTPEDQAINHLEESDTWYSADFEDESEDE